MPMNKSRAMTIAMLLALAALLGSAGWLAWHRIYQVDEAQNVFMTRVLTTGQSDVYFTNALLWMLGPMSWMIDALSDSASIFAWSRMVFLGVFLLNIWLLALNTGRKLTTPAGVAALFGAATLAPLWDYGFEIRHDNLILTCLLLMWWLGRVAPRGRWSYFWLGVLSMAMPFLSFKAVVYGAPLSLALLAFPPPGHGQGRAALYSAWLLGAALAALAIGLAYTCSGAWPAFLAGVLEVKTISVTAVRFSASIALDRVPRQAPLLRELATLGLLWVGFTLCRKRAAALTWDGWLPEALLLLGSVAVLLINPTPFQYNLVNLVPFAYLLAFRVAAGLVEFDWGMRHVSASLFGVLLLAHMVPFLQATPRHFAMSNARQRLLMQTAEAMTDPRTDRVYDAAGLVPSRPTIGFNWYNHSLNRAAFADGRNTPVAQMLAARPAAVILRSYRTDMLPASGSAYIAQRYFPLSDDLWVLGQLLPPGGGTYQVLHPGRYQLLRTTAGPLAPVSLEKGSVWIAAAPGVRPAVVWVGPNLPGLPEIGKGYHQHLFRNFY
jgi:hypothetical protein